MRLCGTLYRRSRSDLQTGRSPGRSGSVRRVFELLDSGTVTEFFCKDGDKVSPGQLLGKVQGDIRILLSGERVALNYLQRMSGIATYTHSVAELLKDSRTKLLDTRKTTPNMRILKNMQFGWAADIITAIICLTAYC